jgi:hypothetical protein
LRRNTPLRRPMPIRRWTLIRDHTLPFLLPKETPCAATQTFVTIPRLSTTI